MRRRRIISIIRAFRLRQWLAVIALAGILAFIGYYTYRSARFAIHYRQPNDEIRGWMTIPHAARIHRVPMEILNAAAGLPPEAVDRRPIKAIARSQGRSFEELQAALATAVVDYRAAHPDETGGQP